MQKRVVITGIGGICGLGNDAPAMWDAMRAGRSAIGPIDNPSLHDLKVKTGCEIKELPEHGIDRKQVVSMDRFSLLAVIAAREAMRQSGLTAHADNTYRMGAIVGIGVAGFETIEENYRAILLEGRNRAAIFTVPKVMPGAAAGQVSMALGLRGPVFGATSACSSANHAISTAVDQIRLGRANVMVAGGTEAPLVWGVLKGWEALRVLSPDTCRPFSADRAGLVLGEGAGMAVLESYDHAMARGATILAEIAGVGLSADASDIVAPTVEGPEAAMRFCLADAGLNPEDVDYLNAHGTGTKANDQIETAAIKRVFGNHAPSLSVSSTKSMHAHCLGASGGLEMIACVMAIRDGIVPPTANYREPDPECDLDVTPNTARERKIRAALSNSFAFGGTNAVLAFKAV
ncbi:MULTISPECIES: beta-ketoacyl-[acyl-carrier-protein] synthase family protein [unclassified Mesorhizobium]|uniref:beta-ketoacyl-[acyl-carrier-protein] synthase family protein n=2 Tax=Mesorhizobium TaxID=68287 RepID=UPI000F763639|nr:MULTISPECIES: beta-ketoacyl-[acyl-carrier-protein] synthase family protein [unclassified Mesorhizobium]AZO04612.1 beta-ketoacyl-[acyl-carrier-protein] synthase family protein [Mesorhizobium sp. M2A.F.Ca.ET.043.02.1.1]RUW38775.1 beta-ketoacyl-[acyl-carrier-protein] synthase family protein [Mesorhizobium sp. M2A.F.Ca.ET.015.02.1.1]RVC92904.1 beta-ketoacyl-[acyl-carrier-protein] synthase family protein [Mesorhizobium sp. M2A.F.Ca.ET.017.03.2.1]RWB45418.1 MAG: beta-ketoacyl-[acyl-carrier-protein